MKITSISASPEFHSLKTMVEKDSPSCKGYASIRNLGTMRDLESHKPNQYSKLLRLCLFPEPRGNRNPKCKTPQVTQVPKTHWSDTTRLKDSLITTTIGSSRQKITKETKQGEIILLIR